MGINHTVIVIDRTKTANNIVERYYHQHLIDEAIATYKICVEEYEHDIVMGTHHVELICNVEATGE